MSSQVETWLSELGLSKYAQAFADAEIDPDALPHLTEDDLKELGLPIGPRRKAMEAIKRSGARSEVDLRVAIANAVADQSKAEWRQDVRRRKLAIATGAGLVHGMALKLPDWGLDDETMA